LSRYQELIDTHYLEHWNVADYAEALNITAAHLNAICRRHTNINAQQLIHKRLILEAKRNLNYTVLTVNQVSDSLGFQDPGYFNRFFKRHTGQTPKQFRNA
jgi:AraC family transcriptional activator of pobA